MAVNAQAYFSANPDVAASYAENAYGMTPQQFADFHYENYGRNEQRSPTGSVSNQQILDFLTSNPNLTDAQIVAAMNTYGVSPTQMAQAVGLPLSQVQQRYDAVTTSAVAPPTPTPIVSTTSTNGLLTGSPVTSTTTSTVETPIAPIVESQPTQQTVTDYQGNTYNTATILNLAKQITPSIDPNAVKGGVFSTSGQSVGFNYDEASRILGKAPTASEQVILDMARHLAKEGITDLNQVNATETNRRFGSTFTGGGGTIYEIKKNADGSPVISTWSKDTSDKKTILTGLALAALAFGIPGLTEGVLSSAPAGATLGTIGAEAAVTGTAAGTAAGTSLGTGLTAGAGGLGLSTTGAGLGALGTGAGITAGTGLGTGVLAGSTLGTSLLGAGAGALTGAGLLSGSGLGTTLAGTGTGVTTGAGLTTSTGLTTGTSLGPTVTGTGTGITSGAGGLGLSTTGAGLGTGTGAGITAGTGLAGTGVLTGSGLGTTLLGTGTGALTGTGVLTGSGLGTTLLGTGTGTGVTGGVTGLGTGTLGTGALTTGVGTGLTTAATGLTAGQLASLLSTGLTTGAGLLQQQTSKEAAQRAQAMIDAETAAAKQAAQFRPIGMTTRFGTSQFQTDPVTGQLVSAGYTLSPEAKNAQDRLVKLAESGLQQAEGAQQAFAPLQTGAQSLFGLGNQYLAQSPQDVAQNYLNQQMALLQPGRELELANLQNRLQQQGRGGLSVAQGGTLGATTPELQALFNARAQQEAVLAAQAQQAGQQQVAFGAGLLGQGAGAMGQYYGGQQAAYQPYTTALGQVQGLEQLAQQPLTMGAALGQQAATAGANVGRLGLSGAEFSTRLATGNAATTNPYSTLLSGLGASPAFGQAFGGLFS